MSHELVCVSACWVVPEARMYDLSVIHLTSLSFSLFGSVDVFFVFFSFFVMFFFLAFVIIRSESLNLV